MQERKLGELKTLAHFLLFCRSGSTLDEKKQEKGKVPHCDPFPLHIGRQRRPLKAFHGFRKRNHWFATSFGGCTFGVQPVKKIEYHQERRKIMAVSKDKERFVIYLYPETLEKIKELYRADDCHSRSQFVEKALRFYIGHLIAGDDASYLPTAMLSNMKSIVAESENKISKMLFKVAVELAMVQNAFTWSHKNIDEESMVELRQAVENEVKSVNGMFDLEKAVEWQRESE